MSKDPCYHELIEVDCCCRPKEPSEEFERMLYETRREYRIALDALAET